MSKNEVKIDSNDPRGQNDRKDTTVYTEKTNLGGPIPCLGYGPNPCRLQLSHKVLKAAGMWPNYEVEVIARPGVIAVKLISPPKPSPWETPRQPNPGIIDELMLVTKERLARQKFAREGGYLDVGDEEGEDPLSEEQRAGEDL